MKPIVQLRRIAALLFTAAALSSSVCAQQMNYQGRLTDANGDPVLDGQRVLTFSLYTAATQGTLVWGPFITDGGPGIGHAAQADLVNGRFNVVLGPSDTAGRSLVNGFVGGTRYLEIRDGSNPPMTPRQQVLAAPEALHAAIADTVVTGGIGTAQLADGSVTAAKIAGGTGVWTGSGANVYRPGGNVGIGTSAPGFPLTFADAAGDKISLYSEGLNSWGFGIEFGLLQIHTGNQFGDVAFGYGSSAALTETMRIKGTGNVGIGTQNPIASLGYPANWRGFHVASPTEGLGIVQGNGSARLHLRNTAAGANTQDFIVQNSADRISFTWLGAGLGGRLEAMTIAADGHVGIGTIVPSRGFLQVDSTALNSSVPANNFINMGSIGVQNNSANFASQDVSIYGAGAIWSGTRLMVSSDRRIKNVQGRSDRATDLQTLLALEVTDFSYKDVIGKGNAPQKKLIAQQVEAVYPQAISKHRDVVPDIYQTASLQNGWVSLATSLRKGERVKLVNEKNEGSLHEVLEVTKDKFRTDDASAGDKVFVYGREVDDFRSVDYEAVAMLNVSASQELARKLEAQRSELSELRVEVARLRGERESFTQILTRLEGRLTRLERPITEASVELDKNPGASAKVN